MGRRLKFGLQNGIGSKRYGFARMELTFYALVYKENTGEVHIELIDSLLLDDTERFMQRVNDFSTRSRDWQSQGILWILIVSK